MHDEYSITRFKIYIEGGISRQLVNLKVNCPASINGGHIDVALPVALRKAYCHKCSEFVECFASGKNTPSIRQRFFYGSDEEVRLMHGLIADSFSVSRVKKNRKHLKIDSVSSSNKPGVAMPIEVKYSCIIGRMELNLKYPVITCGSMTTTVIAGSSCKKYFVPGPECSIVWSGYQKGFKEDTVILDLYFDDAGKTAKIKSNLGLFSGIN